MNLAQLTEQLITDTMRVSLPLFTPELAVVGTIVLLLLLRLLSLDRWIHGSVTAFVGLGVALLLSTVMALSVQESPSSTELFTGLLQYDSFTAFYRVFLTAFTLLVVVLTMLSGIPDRDDAPDFYVLLLGATLGMMLMASANHLLMVFLAVEMTSVPSYVLVGFLKGRRKSSEAALKYVVYGAGAAGVMLYGISLLMGLLGTGSLPALASSLAALPDTWAGMHSAIGVTLVLSLLMVFVGIAFKLSLVPFHFWAPDAFEGASAEVGGFLSVASKGAAFALLVRFCLALVDSPAIETPALRDFFVYVGVALGIVAAVTATLGNLSAYTQTNIKRLLAYSTIAHAGYMLMAVAALLVLIGGSTTGDTTAGTLTRVVDMNQVTGCVSGLLFYLVTYLFMNLGAFAIVALIRNQSFSEEIPSYSGLVKQSPVMAVCMLLCMFSLVGLPPMAGFFGKFMIFASVFQAGKLNSVMWVVLAIGGLNTVFSLVYYIRVLKYMFLGEIPEDAREVKIPANSRAGWFALAVSVPVLVFGIFPPPVETVSRSTADALVKSVRTEGLVTSAPVAETAQVQTGTQE